MKKILKGFSEKTDGSMYLPLADALPENIAHRKEFFEKRGLAGKQIAVADLVHGTRVAVIDRQSPYIIPKTDILVTAHPDIILTLTGADCFPVYLENKQAGVIGLAHCGWRGIVAGVMGEALQAMESIGGKKSDIVLTIGPGICTKHFEIQEDVVASFADQRAFVVEDNSLHVDLKGIMRKQAEALGILPEKIVDSGECTYCLPEKYFSYRRDKPAYLENQIAYIVQSPHRKF
ncbi:MAG: polyphenol oxidase family protein [Candidatus Moranbacteria bacterium]|nr:polyphenol oxidase family protein [Candidatus Moranbacteria bacterium]